MSLLWSVPVEKKLFGAAAPESAGAEGLSEKGRPEDGGEGAGAELDAGGPKVKPADGAAGAEVAGAPKVIPPKALPPGGVNPLEVDDEGVVVGSVGFEGIDGGTNGIGPEEEEEVVGTLKDTPPEEEEAPPNKEGVVEEEEEVPALLSPKKDGEIPPAGGTGIVNFEGADDGAPVEAVAAELEIDADAAPGFFES